MNKLGKDGYQWKDAILDGLRNYEKNRKYMVNALKHTSGKDSFIVQINEADIRFITEEIEKRRGKDSITEDLRIMIRIYCYGTGQYLYDWLMDDKPDSCEKAAELMDDSLPPLLRQYLYE